MKPLSLLRHPHLIKPNLERFGVAIVYINADDTHQREYLKLLLKETSQFILNPAILFPLKQFMPVTVEDIGEHITVLSYDSEIAMDSAMTFFESKGFNTMPLTLLKQNSDTSNNVLRDLKNTCQWKFFKIHQRQSHHHGDPKLKLDIALLYSRLPDNIKYYALALEAFEEDLTTTSTNNDYDMRQSIDNDGKKHPKSFYILAVYDRMNNNRSLCDVLNNALSAIGLDITDINKNNIGKKIVLSLPSSKKQPCEEHAFLIELLRSRDKTKLCYSIQTLLDSRRQQQKNYVTSESSVRQNLEKNSKISPMLVLVPKEESGRYRQRSASIVTVSDEEFEKAMLSRRRRGFTEYTPRVHPADTHPAKVNPYILTALLDWVDQRQEPEGMNQSLESRQRSSLTSFDYDTEVSPPERSLPETRQSSTYVAPGLRLQRSPTSPLIDETTVFLRIRALVRTCSNSQNFGQRQLLQLSQLPLLYSDQYLVQLDPLMYNYPSLKALVLGCPELSVVYVYRTPYFKTLQELSHVTLYNAEAYVVERPDATIATIARDVFVALVAFWIQQQERLLFSNNYYHSNAIFNASPEITTAAYLSTLGMPLALLEQTWDANWITLCSLNSILRRAGVANLHALLQPVPVFATIEEPSLIGVKDNDAANTLIYLKHLSQIPIIPELIPDPTATFEDTKHYHNPVVFFPPLVPRPPSIVINHYYRPNTYDNNTSSGSVPVPPPPLPQEKKMLSQTSISQKKSTITTDQDGRHQLMMPIQRSGRKEFEPKIIRRASAANDQREYVSQFVLSRQDLHSMLFELIAINCKWQEVCWLEGEDLIELEEERHSALHQRTTRKEKEAAEYERGDRISFLSSVASSLSSLSSEEEEEEEGQKHTMGRTAHLKKKQLRENKWRLRSLLRDWNRKHQEKDFKETLITETSKTDDNAQKTECHKKPIIPSENEEAFIREIICRIEKDRSKNNDDHEDEERKKFRHRSVGIFVSSIKAEWSKYFDNCYPLTYFLEQRRIKKIKSLLLEVPNLILIGDGGFMRVSTIDHAKHVCHPDLPKGFGADGKTLVDSIITPEALLSNTKFVPDTYLKSIPDNNVKTFSFKSQFLRYASSINQPLHPEYAQLTTVLDGHPSNDEEKASSVVDRINFPRRSMPTFLTKTTTTPATVAIWSMPSKEAKDVIKIMIVDMVRLQCIKAFQSKKRHYYIHTIHDKTPEKLFIMDRLTENQIHVIHECYQKGMEGFRIADLPIYWNASFPRFSPMSSFIKKAGFDNIKDPAFLDLIKSLEPYTFVVSTTEGHDDLLFPGSFAFLEDKQYLTQASTSSWLKRRSLEYLTPSILKL